MVKRPVSLDPLSFPRELGEYLKGAEAFDSSCSETAKTYLLKKGGESFFLKTGAKQQLERESRMTRHLHAWGLSPELIFYASRDDQAYMVTCGLPGEDGIAKIHLDDPHRLAQVFGENLRQIHALPMTACPHPQRQAELLESADSQIARKDMCPDHITEDFQAAQERFQSLRQLAATDVVIHGDYCLPNIILNDWRLSGFIDLGFGGLGDSHYDLYWGLWTLEYNLKSNKYNDIFLDAYGRQAIETERLEWNRLLSGFTN